MGKGDTNSLAEIMGRLRDEFATSGELILPTPLGPITIENLTNLKGWVYEFSTIGFPGDQPPILLGGPPVVLADFTDEKGWILSFGAVFRSPFGQLNFQADSHNFSATPFLLNTLGQVLPNPITIYNGVYNPATALGPMYSVLFTPAYPQPYERIVRLTLNLPAGAPIAATNIFLAMVSRIKIIDYPTFIRSIKKFTAEQMIGRKLDRYP